MDLFTFVPSPDINRDADKRCHQKNIDNEINGFHRRSSLCAPATGLPRFLVGLSQKIHAADFNFFADVIEPMVILGRSLSQVQMTAP